MEKKTKAETFVGFIVRSGKYRVGLNSVASLKSAFLIIVCHTASENSKKEAKSLANKLHCPLLITKEKPLEDLIFRANVKIMAVTDRGLAKAVIENSLEDFISEI